MHSTEGYYLTLHWLGRRKWGHCLERVMCTERSVFLRNKLHDDSPFACVHVGSRMWPPECGCGEQIPGPVNQSEGELGPYLPNPAPCMDFRAPAYSSQPTAVTPSLWPWAPPGAEGRLAEAFPAHSAQRHDHSWLRWGIPLCQTPG